MLLINFLPRLYILNFTLNGAKKELLSKFNSLNMVSLKDAKKRERGVNTLYSKNVKGKPVFPTHTNAFTVLGCSNTGSCQNFPLLIEFKAII